MKFALTIFTALLSNISCNKIIDDVNNNISPSPNIFQDPKYLLDLEIKLGANKTILESIVKDEMEKPPIKLTTPTKVATPPLSEVKRHWYHAIVVSCSAPGQKWECDRGCHDYKIVETFKNATWGTDATIGVEPSTKEIILQHKGIHSLQNYASNQQNSLVRMPNTPDNVMVKEGVLGIYHSLAPQMNKYLIDMLNNKDYKGYKVVILGHSLGASIATVHAADIAPKIKEMGFEFLLYAYHSPRTGNMDFVNYVIKQNFTIARYSNGRDPIPHVPSRKNGYVHIPGEFHNPNDDFWAKRFYQCSQDYDEDPNCAYKEKILNQADHMNGFGNIVSLVC